MNSVLGTSVPNNSPISPAGIPRVPSKPKQTSVSLEALVDHYNSQLPDYVEALMGKDEEQAAAVARGPLAVDGSVTKEQVIELIRKQNFRLKRFIRHRSIALLQEVVETNAESRTVGRSYADILDILAVEFPEASTSAACLRWYVVHLWSEADEEGLERPKMPQIRPRSVKRKAT